MIRTKHPHTLTLTLTLTLTPSPLRSHPHCHTLTLTLTLHPYTLSPPLSLHTSTSLLSWNKQRWSVSKPPLKRSLCLLSNMIFTNTAKAISSGIFCKDVVTQSESHRSHPQPTSYSCRVCTNPTAVTINCSDNHPREELSVVE